MKEGIVIVAPAMVKDQVKCKDGFIPIFYPSLEAAEVAIEQDHKEFVKFEPKEDHDMYDKCYPAYARETKPGYYEVSVLGSNEVRFTHTESKYIRAYLPIPPKMKI